MYFVVQSFVNMLIKARSAQISIQLENNATHLQHYVTPYMYY